jgi:signal transduction histidine kinase
VIRVGPTVVEPPPAAVPSDQVGWAGAAIVGAAFAWRAAGEFADGGAALPARALLLFFLFLLLARSWRRGGGALPQAAYFALQASLLPALTALPPHPDIVLSLYIPLALQAALVFRGRRLMVWLALFVCLTILPLVVLSGWSTGLALGIIPAVGVLGLPALVIAHREVEAARAETQSLVDALRSARAELERRSGQADELAALEERNHLSRALHDSVSQTVFGLALQARTARTLVERDPDRLSSQLALIESLAEDSLGKIRGMIERLRPPPAGP